MRAFLTLSVASAIVRQKEDQFLAVEVQTNDLWKKECGKRGQKMSLLQNPGAGMDPSTLQPFTNVTKDGFFLVDCVKDAMYVHGDKFGNNKDRYRMESVSASSIVHYDAHVVKEDRKSMTHEECFRFCRSVPDMGFFGISNGVDCYCTPFYTPMASDSSECDSVCAGDNMQMCGGKTKNSVFAMHTCSDAEAELTTALQTANEAKNKLEAAVTSVESVAKAGETVANDLQKLFGSAGDPVASNLMQNAKIWAGKCQDAATAGTEVKTALETSVSTAGGAQGGDLKTAAGATAAESSTRALDDGVAQAEEATKKLKVISASLGVHKEAGNVTDASKQYLPIMYFVDKSQEHHPQTCGGDLATTPLMGVTRDECAASCDAHVGKCVGYGFFEKGSSICFLYSKFTSVQFYTDCQNSLFLQTRTGDTALCQAKLSKFEGTTLKPDGSGKCDQCLKEATKAARCWHTA